MSDNPLLGIRKRQRQRQPLRRTRGSRKGYNADIDDLPPRVGVGEEDEENGPIDIVDTGTGRLRFYSHIAPRRRDKDAIRSGRLNRATTARSCTHPDIDLSLVSLLSSKDLDWRFGFHHRVVGSPSRSTPASSSPSSSEINNSSSSDSLSSCRVNDKIFKNKYAAPAAARPLAVVDYGSIELDMSGSLLDSIYKIGGSGRRRSKDVFFGGRRFSLNVEPKNDTSENCKDNKTTDRSQTSRVERTERSSSSTTFPLEPAFTVASSSISSLKNTSTAERAASPYSVESPVCKKQKTAAKAPAMNSAGLPIVDKVPTSLEAAISFSPFARVLFCAQAPYTIVHTNAAYSTLVQQGLAKSCIVGEGFASGSERYDAVESPEEYITRIVSDHIIGTSRADEEENSSQPRKIRPGCVHIFPVMSIDETCSQFVRSYEKHHLHLGEMDIQKEDVNCISRRSRDPAAFSQDMPSPVNPGEKSFTQYKSHYLLQIEPSGQLPIR